MDGASEGEWQTAANWSTGKVPTSVDVACIGEGTTVKVNESSQAGVVQGKGGVKITGTLEVANVARTVGDWLRPVIWRGADRRRHGGRHGLTVGHWRQNDRQRFNGGQQRSVSDAGDQ